MVYPRFLIFIVMGGGRGVFSTVVSLMCFSGKGDLDLGVLEGFCDGTCTTA